MIIKTTAIANKVKNDRKQKEWDQMEALYQEHDCTASEMDGCKGCETWATFCESKGELLFNSVVH